MKTLILDDFLKKTPDRDNVHKCFECGAEVPDHIVACWNCGHVLDDNIRNLVEDK